MTTSAMSMFAMAAPGLEKVLAAELKGFGIAGRVITGGIEFSGEPDRMMQANLLSRVASRILVRLAEFHASSFHELERRAKKIEWERFLAPGQTVRLRVTCRKSKLYHSDAVAERLLRASGAEAASDDGDDDDSGDDISQLFIVRIANDICTISADSSGALLHRRGYRQAVAKAPLRETLAAAVIIGSGWKPEHALVDPLCGSGTIAIEAAMIARSMAPGLSRTFAFETWPSHDSRVWAGLQDEARAQVKPRAPAPLLASDRDAGAVEAAIRNAERAGVRADIEVTEAPLTGGRFPEGLPGWIVTNPPYGVRVGDSRPLRNLYASLGRLARSKGYKLALLSADTSLEAQLGTGMLEIFRTKNGGIPVRLIVG